VHTVALECEYFPLGHSWHSVLEQWVPDGQPDTHAPAAANNADGLPEGKLDTGCRVGVRVRGCRDGEIVAGLCEGRGVGPPVAGCLDGALVGFLVGHKEAGWRLGVRVGA